MLILIGLPGVGKTTVGRFFSEHFDFHHEDTDSLLIKKTGVSVSAIFEFEGESGFRDRETKLLIDLLALQAKNTVLTSSWVLSTGGGVILRAENRTLLRELGVVVYLHVPVYVLLNRLKHDKKRPLIRNSTNLEETLTRLYETRDPLYRETAHHVIDCTHANVSKTVHSIMKRILRASPSVI